jgi:Fe-S-cluster containining protein
MLNESPTAAPVCRRCGECCRKGGPGLHEADAPLFDDDGPLDFSHVVALRAGELVYDQVRGRVLPLEREMLKLKPAPATAACAFYRLKDRSCGLYEARPEECRALFCADTAPLAALYDKNRLRRADLLPAGHGVLSLMAEHDALVPPARVSELARALRAGESEAAPELRRMALADRAFRDALSGRAGIGPQYHDFFLGRAAAALFSAFGLALRADARQGVRVQADPLWTDPARD